MAGRVDSHLVGKFARLRYALRALTAANEAIARDEGVTPQQFQAMLAICGRPGPTALKDLAQELFLQHSAAVQLFSRLEATGFVVRESTPNDRRLVHVRLTPAGDDLLMLVLRRQLAELQQRGDELRHLIAAVQRLAS